MKRKKPMPGYYGRNIVRNAERKFLRRKALEREEQRAERALYEAEKRTDEFERGERDRL